MKKNLGMADRVIRLIIGTAVALLYMSDIISGVSGTIIVIAALILLMTAPAGFCPIYTLFKISTNKEPQHEDEEAVK